MPSRFLVWRMVFIGEPGPLRRNMRQADGRERMLRTLVAGLVGSVVLAAFWPVPARADLTACNLAPWPISVSLAHNDKDKGWVSIGWWELKREECDALIAGSVQGRKIYGYAQARATNGSAWWWGDLKDPGIETLCTPEQTSTHFTIYMNEVRGNCKHAGNVERGFRLLSPGNHANLTYSFFHNRPLTPEDDRAQKPKERFWECNGCPEMVVVPAGELVMGSPENEPERRAEEGPRHKVTVRERFAVSKGAITREQYEKFVDATGHAAGDKCLGRKDGNWTAESGRSFRNPGFAQDNNHPAVCVSFDDAKTYLAWVSKQTGKPYRLLTEAEWEYVARAGTQSPFWWGSPISTDQANYNGNIIFPGGTKGEFRQKTVGAQTFKPNPWTLLIGAGNAAEWVEDCWNKSYQGAPADGSAWTKGDCSRRVIRGGSWASDPSVLRSAARVSAQNGVRSSDVGFRVARSMAQ
jgi:formylglycine-generating enzyme required for sulfatase activity